MQRSALIASYQHAVIVRFAQCKNIIHSTTDRESAYEKQRKNRNGEKKNGGKRGTEKRGKEETEERRKIGTVRGLERKKYVE